MPMAQSGMKRTVCMVGRIFYLVGPTYMGTYVNGFNLSSSQHHMVG